MNPPRKPSTKRSVIRPALVTELRQQQSSISKFAWKPDGKAIAIPTEDGFVSVEKVDVSVSKKIGTGQARVLATSWSSDGEWLAAGLENGRLQIFHAAENYSDASHASPEFGFAIEHVAFSLDDPSLLAVGIQDGSIFTVKLGEDPNQLHQAAGPVRSLAWGPEGQLAACSESGEVLVLAPDVRKTLWTVPTDQTSKDAIAWCATNDRLAVARQDGRIDIWDVQARKHRKLLEGHFSQVINVQFSPGGEFLVSDATFSRSILWDVESGKRASLGTPTSSSTALFGGAAFDPSDSYRIAIRTKNERMVSIFSLDRKSVEREFEKRSIVKYSNAKVVLLGNQNAGKSGLALRLAGQEFENTSSTHARKTFTFPLKSAPGNEEVLREVQIWDLAGQYGYRLFHQLHLSDVEVAIVVFDSQSDLDPLWGVEYWNQILKVLDQSEHSNIKKFLVAARSDRGVVCLPKDEIESFCRNEGFGGRFFETCAKAANNPGIERLRDAVEEAIDWDSLPTVDSEEIIRSVRSFVMEEASSIDAVPIQTSIELREKFSKRNPQEDKAEIARLFEHCIDRLEVLGMVRRLGFDELVLLKPEYFDYYAASMIQAARAFAIGHLPKQDVLKGHYRPADPDLLLSSPECEQKLWRAIVEDLISRKVALEVSSEGDGQQLVFPQISPIGFRETYFADIENHIEVSFRLEGMIATHFATLVVQMSKSHIYNHEHTRPNVAKFSPSGRPKNAVCGFALVPTEPGKARLDVFFEGDVDSLAKKQFVTYIVKHFDANNIKKVQEFRYRCRCGCMVPPVVAKAFERREQSGVQVIREYKCHDCDAMVDLKKPSIEVDEKSEGSDQHENYVRTLSQWTSTALEAAKKGDLKRWFSDSTEGFAVIAYTVLGDHWENQHPDDLRCEAREKLAELQYAMQFALDHIDEWRDTALIDMPLGQYPLARLSFTRNRNDVLAVLKEGHSRLLQSGFGAVASGSYCESNDPVALGDAIHRTAVLITQAEPGLLLVDEGLQKLLEHETHQDWRVQPRSDGSLVWSTSLDRPNARQVYFSFDSRQEDVVAELAQQIERAEPRVRCHCYHRDNIAGENWREKNQRLVDECEIFVFFQGKDKFRVGSWHESELSQIECRRQMPPVIPVLLPGRKGFAERVTKFLNSRQIHSCNLNSFSSVEQQAQEILKSLRKILDDLENV